MLGCVGCQLHRIGYFGGGPIRGRRGVAHRIRNPLGGGANNLSQHALKSVDARSQLGWIGPFLEAGVIVSIVALIDVDC